MRSRSCCSHRPRNTGAVLGAAAGLGALLSTMFGSPLAGVVPLMELVPAGGKFFPVACAGGATGLAIHLAIPGIPMPLAVGVGLSAAMATALGTPVTAALVAASLLSPRLLPLAVLGVVAAHAVDLMVQAAEGARCRAAAPISCRKLSQ